jgi:ABC-type uncharacterized transport system permease subunit
MWRWYVCGFVVAAAISWVVTLFHSAGFAPFGLISVSAGLALGAVLCALATTLRVADRSHLIIGTLILAVVTALAQHAWLYRDFRRQWQEARASSAELAMFRPESPWSPAEYLAHELTPGRAAFWTLDAALVVAAAVSVVVWWHRRPK